MRVVFMASPTPNPAPAYYGPPNGLAILGAMLKQSGHDVVAYDWDRRSVDEMLDLRTVDAEEKLYRAALRSRGRDGHGL